jgi:NAD(P)-dependent dehydrogenase (short-subunit alcohol dehydrogenase family)
MMSEYARYPSLAGRGVIITGGATGIGAALVEAFHEQGARVGFLDKDEAAGAALAARLAGAAFAACDVRDPAAMEQTLAMLGSRIGPVRVLINNVADDTRHQALATDAAAWRAALAVNLDPAFLSARALQPEMAAAGGGSIVNLSSINALLGPADMAAYVTAKAGILGLTKALAREWGPARVRVNAISPGWVVTERQLALWLTPEAEAEWARLTALPGRIEPEDVARLALFLAADDSAMITGQNFLVDAGRT